MLQLSRYYQKFLESEFERQSSEICHLLSHLSFVSCLPQSALARSWNKGQSWNSILGTLTWDTTVPGGISTQQWTVSKEMNTIRFVPCEDPLNKNREELERRTTDK